MELKRVVVTGLGTINPLGNDVETSWKNAIAGVSGAGPITHFDASQFKTKFACEVKGFEPSTIFEKKDVRKYDRYSQLAVKAANEAMHDARFDLEKEDTSRIGVVFGAGIGGIQTFEEEVGNYYEKLESGPRFSPFFIPKMIADIAAGHISILYGLRGPNYATVSACASSSHALIDAYNIIRLGEAVAMITGGAEAAITRAAVGGFNSMHALSTRNESPQTASRPFSKSRDGFVIGEGATAIVLEEREHALARGAHIYAEMVGGGMSADAYHMTASHPDGLGAKIVMRNCLQDAHMLPEDVDYVNVHGTSTMVGDLSEVKAILDVFGKHSYDFNISSTKSMTGHLLGGAGALEAMFCILSIRDNVIPPTINHEEGDLDPDIDYNLNFTFNKAQKRKVDVAMSNTFGFGGHNASVMFKRYDN